MTDLTLDALLEAVREIGTCVLGYDMDADDEQRIVDVIDKLDALIAQRRGRPDDQPARKQ